MEKGILPDTGDEFAPYGGWDRNRAARPGIAGNGYSIRVRRICRIGVLGFDCGWKYQRKKRYKPPYIRESAWPTSAYLPMLYHG